jgi:hypothetical protein
MKRSEEFEHDARPAMLPAAVAVVLEKFGIESKFGLRNGAVSAERSFFCARSLPPSEWC